MFSSIDPLMVRAILPEILLVVLGVIVLVYDLLVEDNLRRGLGWLTAGGLAVIFVVSLAFSRPGPESVPVWGGMLRFDWLGFSFTMLFLFGAAVTSLFAMEVRQLGQRGEFYLLLLASTVGMCLMASAADLVMLFLAIETTSIPLYVLAGFFKTDNKSTEAGFKYLLFGAMTSTVMLYGFSLLYGFTGTTDLYAITQTVVSGELPGMLVVGTLILIMVGFGFKISAVPFHFWAPDVYEGAPTPVAGFLSTASKAAGFAVLMRVLLTVFPSQEAVPYWVILIAALSVFSMTLGNALALAQRNIKRMLAYSSIAHAGYALIGVAALSQFGIASVVFYLIAYTVTNLAAFGIVAAFWRVSGSDEIADYAALSRRSPALALALMVALLSLAGMPPLGGFVAKVFVFAAAINTGLVWLAVIGVLNSIVGLYYYLIVLKVVYLYRSENEEVPVPLTRPYALAITVLIAGIILLGTIFAPWFDLSTAAAAALF
ncbi:MAG TPA: NADH-quinone oxidoreductase subunit N [Anaerolineales bacterium]|nr:NADH-quinone oxidoreductase subunit N [Anaerolineales bacterium]